MASTPNQEDGIKAVNQNFRKYDQVNKEQTYHLVEKQDVDEFDEAPFIDNEHLIQKKLFFEHLF